MLTKTIAGAVLSIALIAQTQAQSIEVGSGVFCDTQAEMERFVALFEGDMQTAMNAVNTEMKDPTACVSATIAFTRAQEVAKLERWSETYRIVQMTVVGVLTNQGPQAIEPAIVYSIKRTEERGA